MFWMPHIGGFIEEIRDLRSDILKCIGRSSDEKFFLSAGNQGRVLLWDIYAATWNTFSQKLSPRIKGDAKEELWRHRAGVTGLLCLKTEKIGEYLVASCAQDKTISVASYFVRSSYTSYHLECLLAYYFSGNEKYRLAPLPGILFSRIDRLRDYAFY